MRLMHRLSLVIFSGVVPLLASSQAQTIQEYIPANYSKQEVDIPMRDGITLHTTIYSPKDQSRKYPIIMTRTPYSSKPYGLNQFPSSPGGMAANERLLKEGNIFVKQDVRGRWMSDGDFDNMRPYIPNKKGKQTDEASDTYDTIDWLVKNVKNNNGNVGIWGISYPGFYSTYSLLSNHPALKAVSPQAPISDFFFDDFHHNGAYLLSYFMITSVFGNQFPPTTDTKYTYPDIQTRDAYSFFLKNTPMKKLDRFYPDNFFWNQLRDHPDYDEFWQARSILPHLKNIKPAVLFVGGFFDAEDLYGPFQSYRRVEDNSKNFNILAMGPWSHGQWASTEVRQALGNVYFGDSISRRFQDDIMTRFFNYFLKGEGNISDFPEAKMYDTGLREWNDYESWPPKNTVERKFYLGAEGKLTDSPQAQYANQFVSDIKKPVPYSEDIKVVFTPRMYMTADQRFAARRPDVLVYETEQLEENVKFAGEIDVNLNVATTGTDADWIVKVIDVFPDSAQNYPETAAHQQMSNYHMMLRSEIMPSRFRKGFTTPIPMKPVEKTAIHFVLQGINHTFRKGHKMQVQVQSTWFPLFRLNPQTFVPNIFKADERDFQTQTHTVFGDSYLQFNQVP